MNHESAQELLADFALELLEERQAAEVRAHIARCAVCDADLQIFLQAAEALALAPEPVELPAGAIERITAGVRGRMAGPVAQPALRESKVIEGPWRRIALGTAAAVLLLAVGLTATGLAWLDARDDADQFEEQLAARAIELPLSGEGASGAIYVASDFGSGVARFSGLAPAPAQHHYQVWSEGPSGPQSAADFQGAQGELLVRLPELPRDMTRMFVTIEPDGAANDRPTGPEVLSTPR